MDKKKKLFLAIGIAAAVIIIAVIIIIAVHKSGSSGDSGEDVYVSSIADITGNNGVGSVNRYAGVIEPQETKEIQKSSDKTVKEILVSEGDEVKVGTNKKPTSPSFNTHPNLPSSQSTILPSTHHNHHFPPTLHPPQHPPPPPPYTPSTSPQSTPTLNLQTSHHTHHHTISTPNPPLLHTSHSLHTPHHPSPST